jgi:tetratricopeptide (TPR) repeat protein/NAD-dependent SIR2 family protein deacetylase
MEVGELDSAEFYYSQVLELEPGPIAREAAIRGKKRVRRDMKSNSGPADFKMPDSSQVVLTDLVELIRHGKTVIFCGAGISYNSGLPLAGPFMTAVLDTLNANQDEIDSISRVSIPFESFVGILQENSSIDALLDIYEVGQPNPNHTLIANLMVSGNLNTVVTTNFDKLIERALTLQGWVAGADYDIYYRDEDFSGIEWESTRPKLIKIHGSIHDRTDIAITMQLVAGKRHAESRKTVIDKVFGSGKHKRVLVLGYSSSDSFDLVPYIETIDEGHREVVVVAHDNSLTDTIQIEDIRQQKDKNPFAKFRGSYRLRCSTDALVQKIWNATLKVPYKIEPVAGEDAWMKAIADWSSSLPSEAAEHLIIGRIMLDINNRSAAVERLQQAIEIARTVEDTDKESFALSLLGTITKSVHRLKEALAIAVQTGDKSREADCLCSLSSVLFSKGRADEAIACCHAGLDAAICASDRLREARLLGNLGSIYGSRNEFDKAIGYFTEACRIAREVGDKAAEGAALYNTGLVYKIKRQIEKAMDYYEQAYSVLRPFLGDNHPVAIEVKKHL